MRIQVNVLKSIQIMLLLGALGILAVSVAYAMTAPGDGAVQGSSEPAPAATVSPTPIPTMSGFPTLLGMDEGGILGYLGSARALVNQAMVKQSRVEISWALTYPSAGASPNWSDSDTTIHGLLNGGLDPVVYIGDNPEWAVPGSNCGPIDTNDSAMRQKFTDFVTQTVQRYPQIHTWALYNEEDKAGNSADIPPCFGGNDLNGNHIPDYQEYAIELKAFYQAVHNANHSAKVAMGALAYDNFKTGATTCPPKQKPPKFSYSCRTTNIFNYSFLTNVLSYMKQHPGPYMDVMLFNYYDIYGGYWEQFGKGHGIVAKTNVLKAALAKAGFSSVPLQVTETGEDSGNWWIGTTGQARCLDITLTRGVVAGLKGVVWWTFEDNPGKASPSVWKYGIVDQNIVPKPSYTALQTLTREFNTFNFKTDVSNKVTKALSLKNVEAYQFTSGATSKYILWSSQYVSNNPGSKTNNYRPYCAWARKTVKATFKAKTLRVVDYMGAITTIKDNSKQDKDKVKGTITIQVANNPQIVQVNPPAH